MDYRVSALEQWMKLEIGWREAKNRVIELFMWTRCVFHATT
jgi:hypothetical protein